MLFSGLWIILRGKVQCKRFMAAEWRFRPHSEQRNRTISVSIADVRSGRLVCHTAPASRRPGAKEGNTEGNTVFKNFSKETIAGSRREVNKCAGPVRASNARKTRVKKTLFPLGDYCRSNDRIDAKYDIPVKGRSALLSGHFFYFGRNAIKISEIPAKHLDHEFEKTGPGYRCDFSEEFVEDFANWLQDNFKTGVHGGRGKRVRSRFGRLGKSFFPRLVFWLLTRMALSQRIYGIFAIAATAA